MVLFHCPEMKDFLGRSDKGFIKLASLTSFLPKEVSQLQGIAQRIHLILALPNPAIEICMVSLVMAFPVLLNIKRVGIGIFENQGHLAFDQTSNGLTQTRVSFCHMKIGPQLSRRVTQPHSWDVPC